MEEMNPNEIAQAQQIEELKKKVLFQMLSKEAFERLGRVRVVNPNLVGQVELYLLQVYQTGKINKQISDKEMKEILKSVSERKSFNIRRK